MKIVSLQDVISDSKRLAKDGKHMEAIKMLNITLEQRPECIPVLYTLGCILFDAGLAAIALTVFERAEDLMPDDWRIQANMASSQRKMYLIEEAIGSSLLALELMEKHEPYHETDEELRKMKGGIYSNLSACHVNEGSAAEGEHYARKALEYIPEDTLPRWNLALVCLEQGKWAEGFSLYRAGIESGKRSRRNYRKDGELTPVLTELEDLNEGQTVVVYGEQGLGDEIMFASIIPEFAEYCRKRDIKIILEPKKKLEELFKAAFGAPHIEVFGTRHQDTIHWPENRDVDWCMPIGQLAYFFRKELSDFRGHAKRYLWADKSEVDELRDSFNTFEEKPVIGLTWTGGFIKTAAGYRSLSLEQISPVLELDAHFVCLQYDDPREEIQSYRKRYGRFAKDIEIMYEWTGVKSPDLQPMLNLIDACDVILTVCQSVAHMAGALGKPVVILCPDKCAWRYLPVEYDYQIWYENNTIVRKQPGESWAQFIPQGVERVKEKLNG